MRALDRAEDTAGQAVALGRLADDPAARSRAWGTLSLITAHRPDGRGAAYARRGLALGG